VTCSGKDSEEVVEFMALFARLKDRCEDSPERLLALAASDSGARTLCIDLSLAVAALRVHERRAHALFAAPVDPAFLASWRDCEERYSTVLAAIFLDFDDGSSRINSAEPPVSTAAERQWEASDKQARDEASGIEEVFDFVRFNVEGGFWDRFGSSAVEDLEDGLAGWDGFKHQTGFDLRGVFRRRALIPFILVPTDVAARYGSGHKLSMFAILQQAHDAFVYGAMYAALALMRSILEEILRVNYEAKGSNLKARIRDPSISLPAGANMNALDRIRIYGNDILHLKDRAQDSPLAKFDQSQLEREIVSLLFVLRTLIEEAP